MHCINFTYDGESAEEHGVMICSFDGAEDGTFTAGSKVEMSTVKAPNRNRWMRTNAVYSEQLTFSFSICKHTCNSVEKDMFFSAEDQARITRWLCRKNFYYLSFDQEGFENIYYHAFLTVERRLAGGLVIGYDITATCDAPWGYSNKRHAVVNSEKTRIFNASDEVGGLLPEEVKIKVAAAGDVSITNLMTKETPTNVQVTKIANCCAGEIITLTDRLSIYSNTAHVNLYNDFNWEFVRLYSQYSAGMNEFALENCKQMEITWREVRKAVV